MKRFCVAHFSALALMLSFQFATNSASASTFAGPFTINSIIIGGVGMHISVSPTPVGCTNTWSGTQVAIASAQSNFKDLEAGVLTAYTAGLKIQLFYDAQGDGTCSFENQPLINAIQISH